MGFVFRVAWRYFSSKRKTSFISLIAFLSIGGTAIGVTALIVVLGVMTGFDQQLFETVLGNTSDIVITREGGIIDWREVIAEVRTADEVVAAAPFFEGQVLLRTDANVTGAAMRGIVPEAEGTVTDFLKNLAKGEGTLEPKGIVLGKELARKLRVGVGDSLHVISPYFISTPQGEVPLKKRMEVTGLFVSGMYEYDSTFCYVHMPVAQALFGVEKAVAGIEVKLEDPYRAELVSRELSRLLGYRYAARSWMELNRTFFAALRHEKIIMAVILILIVLVAAFNIASTLIMVVMEKTKDIGILKSIGVSSRRIGAIFIVEGLIVGAMGLLLGNLGGLVLSWKLNAVVDFLEQRLGLAVFPAEIYYFQEIPVLVTPAEVLAINVFALAISLLAAWYPAQYAARLDPVQTLRYE